jgi:hypothetical protein
MRSDIRKLWIYFIVGDTDYTVGIFRDNSYRKYRPTPTSLERCVRIAKRYPNYREYKSFLESGIITE